MITKFKLFCERNDNKLYNDTKILADEILQMYIVTFKKYLKNMKKEDMDFDSDKIFAKYKLDKSEQSLFFKFVPYNNGDSRGIYKPNYKYKEVTIEAREYIRILKNIHDLGWRIKYGELNDASLTYQKKLYNEQVKEYLTVDYLTKQYFYSTIIHELTHYIDFEHIHGNDSKIESTIKGILKRNYYRFDDINKEVEEDFFDKHSSEYDFDKYYFKKWTNYINRIHELNAYYIQAINLMKTKMNHKEFSLDTFEQFKNFFIRYCFILNYHISEEERIETAFRNEKYRFLNKENKKRIDKRLYELYVQLKEEHKVKK